MVGMAVVAVDVAEAADLRANHPSSSSRRVRAGRGAPGPSPPSVVGSLTLPSVLNGLYFAHVPSSGFCGLVLAGCSRRDQPMLFMLSLNEDDAMVARSSCGFVLERRSLFEDGQQLELSLVLCCGGSGVGLNGCLFAGRVSTGFVLQREPMNWKGERALGCLRSSMQSASGVAVRESSSSIGRFGSFMRCTATSDGWLGDHSTRCGKRKPSIIRKSLR